MTNTEARIDSNAPETEKSFSVIEKVRTLMCLLELKQKDISESLNLKPSQISHYLNHRREIKANNLLALLETVGVDVNEILQEKIQKFMLEDFEQREENILHSRLGRVRGKKKKSLLNIIRIIGD